MFQDPLILPDDRLRLFVGCLRTKVFQVVTLLAWTGRRARKIIRLLVRRTTRVREGSRDPACWRPPLSESMDHHSAGIPLEQRLVSVICRLEAAHIRATERQLLRYTHRGRPTLEKQLRHIR